MDRNLDQGIVLFSLYNEMLQKNQEEAAALGQPTFARWCMTERTRVISIIYKRNSSAQMNMYAE